MRYLVSFQVPTSNDRVKRIGEFRTKTAPVLPSVGDNIWVTEEGRTATQRMRAYEEATPGSIDPGEYYRVRAIRFLYHYWRRSVHETFIEIVIEPADPLEEDE